MIKHVFSEPALTGLAKLQFDLKKQGGPFENGHLFEQILDTQSNILKSFGLPINPDNEKLVKFTSIPTASELRERVNQLHSAATEYLLSNAKFDLQIMREAQEDQSDPMYILPELKIATHIYRFLFLIKFFWADKIALKIFCTI